VPPPRPTNHHQVHQLRALKLRASGDLVLIGRLAQQSSSTSQKLSDHPPVAPRTFILKALPEPAQTLQQP
jgi:hypothetical protein